MKFNFRKYSLVALASAALLSSCSSSDGESAPADTYDRDAMVAHYADNLIIPAYATFSAKAEAMHTAINAFAATPTAVNLQAARAAYLDAYTAWQDASVFEFGPASDQLLRTNLNIYPTSSAEIEANITAGTYDLQAAANLDAKGFPALDYLLYNAADATLLEQYTNAANAAKRKKYLQDVSALIKQRAAATYQGWTNGGYTSTFKQAKGTAVGSAIGSLVNELNQDIDNTKRNKIGFPSGRFSQGTTLPDRVEAYYSQSFSLELLKRSIKAEKAVFMGMTTNGTNGPGLDDYLDYVKAPYGQGLLSDAIEQQFDAALAAVNAIQEPLVQAVNTQPQAVTKAYDELQKLIVLTKTDMPSALGVTITYNDSDGD
ncbi:imelysin family protein [Pontibacter oryzae]|nr:imelysin family protein [Pontibacter oryzae]